MCTPSTRSPQQAKTGIPDKAIEARRQRHGPGDNPCQMTPASRGRQVPQQGHGTRRWAIANGDRVNSVPKHCSRANEASRSIWGMNIVTQATTLGHRQRGGQGRAPANEREECVSGGKTTGQRNGQAEDNGRCQAVSIGRVEGYGPDQNSGSHTSPPTAACRTVKRAKIKVRPV